MRAHSHSKYKQIKGTNYNFLDSDLNKHQEYTVAVIILTFLHHSVVRLRTLSASNFEPASFKKVFVSKTGLNKRKA